MLTTPNQKQMEAAEKKSRILYVLRFLEEQTDEAHTAAIRDILEYLSGNGISATRKTVAQDIGQLIEAGVDVICNKGRQNQYFIGDRHFELPELKLLIDAAQASRFLTVKRSRKLIGKLLALTSRHQSLELSNGLYFDNQVKQKNENSYITADLLLKAINTKKRTRFMYYEYDSDKKRPTNTNVKSMNLARGISFGTATAIISLAIPKTTVRLLSFAWTGLPLPS